MDPSSNHLATPLTSASELSLRGRYFILVASFLGWMFAGLEMSLLPLAANSATESFVASASAEELKALLPQWFIYYIVAFLLGAAMGGLVFGYLGDRLGRARTMGISILWYSFFTGVSYFAASLEQLTALRFVACLGIGGMWPSAVSLVSEAWPNVSRPKMAGLIGASANVGILLMGIVGRVNEIRPDSWRWVMLVGATPLVLGLIVLFFLPESPQWLASRAKRDKVKSENTIAKVFRPPLLYSTIVGIFLGCIPLLGGWGAQKWMLPWAASVGKEIGDFTLKADTQVVWGIGATLGSLFGGWLASRYGRRCTYFSVSLGSLLIASFIFRVLTPERSITFLGPIFLMGLVSTVYFGWLPLYLPELFPTEVRATGTGISFNFGRIISAAVILGTLGLAQAYGGDFAKIGATTSLIYLLGMIVIWFAPKTSGEMIE